jgi:hypothetical protein
MLSFRRLDAVVVPDGQIGMIETIKGEYATIQFGAAGPFRRFKLTSLRWVTCQEVKDAGMHGTGFNIVSDRQKKARAAEQQRKETGGVY